MIDYKEVLMEDLKARMYEQILRSVDKAKDLVATDNQSQDKPLKSATPTPLNKQEDN